MKLVAITRVKNEADIIEPFVRHTCKHFDELVMQDHDSTDATRSIVEALRAEGLNVRTRGTRGRNTQGYDMTVLMREAFEGGADWVMPLDADEFVETPPGTTFRDILGSQEALPLNIFWNNFAVGSGARPPLHNPVTAMRSRNTRRSQFAKVCIPRRFGGDAKTTIYEGNHFLVRKKRVLPARDMLDVVLCHYPIRSIEQFAYKVVIGTFRYIANPSQDKHKWGWHYEKAFEYLMDGNIEGLNDVMRRTALCYSEEAPQPPDVTDRVLRYLGGDLSHAMPAMTDADVVRGVLTYARAMAHELYDARRKRSAIGILMTGGRT